MPDTALIVGATSTIGRALTARLTARGVSCLGTTRRSEVETGQMSLDLAAPPDSWKLPEARWAFLCAAVTAFSDCRKDPEGTALVNVAGLTALAARLVASGTSVVFYSSNAVFDGAVRLPNEATPTTPASEYGQQKVIAEKRLLALGQRVTVLRLTKVIGPGLPLFAGWKQELLAGRVIRPFSDMVMAPLAVSFVADVSFALAGLGQGGIFHASASHDVSYADAAHRLAGRLGLDSGLVQPVTVAQSGVVMENVPRHTAFATDKLQKALGVAAPDPLAALEEVLHDD